MQLTIVTIIVAIASQSGLKVPTISGPIPYRLLSSQVLRPDQGRSYVVSVEKPLDPPAIKTLLCQIVAAEKPPNTRLEIGVYLGLDEFIPPLGFKPLSDKLAAHRMASYQWNTKLPNDRRRLSVAKDTDGKPLAKWEYHESDHTKCGS